MALIDELKLHIEAGDGGDGVARWRREKFRPKAGPGGGNGGNGGDVFAETVSDLAYLSTYRHEKDFKAPNGEPGRNFGQFGANGKDLTLKFPVGTLLTNLETGAKTELMAVGDKVLILKGGRGGFGNEHFKASTNTTPYESTPGRPGEAADFLVELQLIADVGLVGYPSVGKSTLLNALTNAHSKVGAYHFTTLEPHLGVAANGMVLADVPGIIKGAANGKGLGFRFLKHITRTKMIAHCVAASSDDPVADYHAIRTELATYSEELADKKELVIVTKSDEVSADDLKTIMTDLSKQNKNIVAVSAYDDASLKTLTKKLG